jgi:hypothetical protein
VNQTGLARPSWVFIVTAAVFVLGCVLTVLSFLALLWIVVWDTAPEYPEGHPTLWEDRWSIAVYSGTALAALVMVAGSARFWYRHRPRFPVLATLASKGGDRSNSSNG